MRQQQTGVAFAYESRVLVLVYFIGVVMIIGISAWIVIRHARTERARSRKRWAAVERDVGTYYGGDVGTYYGGGG